MEKLRRNRLVRFIWDLVDLYFTKQVSRASAALAYFLGLSCFPAIICINAVIGVLHLDAAMLVERLAPIIPEAPLGIILDYIDYISTNGSHALLAAGLVMLLFSGSAAVRVLMDEMEDIYERKSYTGIWQVVASVVFSVLFLLTVYVSVVVVLTGNWFFHLLEDFLRQFPRLAGVKLPWQWQWMRFLLLFCIVQIFVMLLYRATVPRTRPRAPVLRGAIVASVALVLSSAVFSFFIGLSSRYSLVYGSLGSVVILLVWLYLCGNILILGNCFNRVFYSRILEKRRRSERKEERP